MIPLLLLKVVVKRSRFRKNQEKREEEQDPVTLAPHEEQKSSTRSEISPLSLRFFFKSFSSARTRRARTKSIHQTKYGIIRSEI
jgi:hypothetical protein|tara:strand:- start:490 stop:741 length:252 start_codon:yes stop_codon:yes gene_type:complete